LLNGPDDGPRPPGSCLAPALASIRAAAASRRLRHIVRLGRLTAYERLADLILELHDRQAEAGGPDISPDGAMVLPLTQEVIADHLGLSNVHTNRMLQQLRHDGLIRLEGRSLVVPDLARLAAATPD
jgi:CRP-like cAMP-binding protein